MAIFGPLNATRDEIERAIAEQLDTGKAPEGWRVKFTEWRDREVGPEQQQDLWSAFRNFADKAERDIADGSTLLEDDSDRDRESEEEE